MKNIRFFFLKTFNFFCGEISIYLNRCVFCNVDKRPNYCNDISVVIILLLLTANVRHTKLGSNV